MYKVKLAGPSGPIFLKHISSYDDIEGLEQVIRREISTDANAQAACEDMAWQAGKECDEKTG